MAPLNIDSLLGKTKNRIYRVGVELEGAWNAAPKGAQVIRDGSVFHDTRPAVVPGTAKVGEIVSPIKEIGEVPSWIRKYYPDFSDASCGLHIHMSFRHAHHYQLLLVPEYTDTIVKYLTSWAEESKLAKAHAIWERLAGKSEYCQLKFFGDKQIFTKGPKNFNRNFDGHRYTAINYCFGLHGTVECRILPMMESADHAIDAVKRVLSITNACIVKLARREEKKKVEILDGDDSLYDLREVKV